MARRESKRLRLRACPKEKRNVRGELARTNILFHTKRWFEAKQTQRLKSVGQRSREKTKDRVCMCVYIQKSRVEEDYFPNSTPDRRGK